MFSNFQDYLEASKDSVYDTQRKEINKDTFLHDIKICKDYLEIINKMKENDFFPENFIDFLENNLKTKYGKYSLLTIDSSGGNNSWYFMSPELQENFYISFLQVKSWIEKIKEDELIK